MPTIRDIAREAGVSVSTVSLAINGDPRVKNETRELITRIAERLGYRPTYAARSLSSGKSWIVNVINPVQPSVLTSGFSSRFLHGVHDVARRHRYTVSLTVIENELEAVEAIETLAFEHASDGAILVNPSQSDSLIETLRKHDFPHVMLGRAPTDGVPSVDNDTVAVGFDAATYLIEQDMAPILFLSGPENQTVTQDRLAGFVQAHSDRGVTLDSRLVLHSTGVPEDARLAVKALLDDSIRFSAVLALSDAQALGAMRAIREHGLGIPSDVAVMGMNNDDVTNYTDPTLSSIELNAFELGSRATTLLLGQIGAIQASDLQHIVDHELVLRESTSRSLSRRGDRTDTMSGHVRQGGL